MTTPTFYTWLDSPVDDLLLTSNGQALTGVLFKTHQGPAPEPTWQRNDAWFKDVKRQLRAYFAGDLQDFSLAVAPEGTRFQRRVWAALQTIPYGETRSYAEVARRIGHPGAARAVGAANGQNPIAVIIPCHRVIGADGTLTGFGGGLKRKRTLLELEANAITKKARLPVYV